MEEPEPYSETRLKYLIIDDIERYLTRKKILKHGILRSRCRMNSVPIYDIEFIHNKMHYIVSISNVYCVEVLKIITNTPTLIDKVLIADPYYKSKIAKMII